MSKRAIIPAAMVSINDEWHMSPGLECDGFVFLTGFNGASLDGHVSSDAREQIETAFSQVDLVLKEGGLTFNDVVEVTSYHIELKQHLDSFRKIWEQYVSPPYPAWTAIEVAGFVTEDVIVELRVIARRAD